MDNQKTIIGLLCVIAIILLVGFAMMSSSMFKENSNLAISDKKIDAGGSLVVVLTNDHGEPIENEVVKIKLTDNDGISIDEKSFTNSKGKAKLKVEEKGKYSVECTFDGNNQYSPSKIKDTVSVKEVKTEVVSQETTTSKSMYDSNGFMYPEYGPDYDSVGTSREKAMAGNYRYLEDVIDGKTVGVYAPYDPNAGTYHW